jgi:hypothetical protein
MENSIEKLLRLVEKEAKFLQMLGVKKEDKSVYSAM